jgi:hypothetical protein
MQILEHTSSHLTLQESSENIWIARLISSIFLIWGSWDVFMVVVDNSFLNFIIAFHIVFLLGIGTLNALFPWRNTVCFDKNIGRLTIASESVFRTKNIVYSLDDIIDTIVQEESGSDGFYYRVCLLISSNPQSLPISVKNYSCRDKVNEIADLIRNFLNIFI